MSVPQMRNQSILKNEGSCLLFTSWVGSKTLPDGGNMLSTFSQWCIFISHVLERDFGFYFPEFPELGGAIFTFSPFKICRLKMTKKGPNLTLRLPCPEHPVEPPTATGEVLYNYHSLLQEALVEKLERTNREEKRKRAGKERRRQRGRR